MTKFISQLTEIKWILIGIVLFIYGLMLKGTLINHSYMTGYSLNGWDITLQFMNDMYLIVYFLIPVTLYFSFQSFKKEIEFHILIRLDSNKQWIFRAVKLFLKEIWPLLFYIPFIATFLMIGLPSSWSWSELSKVDTSYNTLLNMNLFFSLPILSMLFHFFLLLLVILFTHLFLAACFVLSRNKNFVLIVCLFYFLLSVIGFKLFSSNYLALLSPSTYFSVSKAINFYGSPYITALILLLFLLVFPYILKLLDLNKNQIEFKKCIPVISYLSLCIIGIITISYQAKFESTTIWDMFFITFYGVRNETFSYTSYFFYCILYFGFIYLVSLIIYEKCNSLGMLRIIRYKNIHFWFWSWFYKIVVYIFVFLNVLVGIIIFVGFIKGENMEFQMNLIPLDKVQDFQKNLIPFNVVQLLFHFVFNGFLQILLYVFAICVLIWIYKDPTKVLFLISLFMVFLLPAVNINGYLPLGLNSFATLNELPFYIVSIYLLACNSFLYIALYYLFKKSIKF